MRLSITPLLLALTATLIAACSAPSPSIDTAAAAPAANLQNAVVVAEGSFTGMNDHVVTGNVQIVEWNGKSFLRLEDSFSLDGAPDPKVGFGTSGEYNQASTVSPLRQHSGAQDYELPANFTLEHFNQAYIWCDQFSVGLGVANLR
jgi:hypothetical protein